MTFRFSIISAAVPHWGSYGPHHLGITSGNKNIKIGIAKSAYSGYKEKKQVIILLNFSGFLASLSDPHGQGNFGPFQICYDYGISVCGGYPGGFQTRGKTKTPYDNDMTAFRHK